MYFACQGCLSCTILQRCLTNGVLGQPLNKPCVHVQSMNDMTVLHVVHNPNVF